MCAQSRQNLCDPVNCNPPGFSVHGILQARILEQDWTHISCVSSIGRQILFTTEPPGKPQTAWNHTAYLYRKTDSHWIRLSWVSREWSFCLLMSQQMCPWIRELTGHLSLHWNLIKSKSSPYYSQESSQFLSCLVLCDLVISMAERFHPCFF